MHRLGWRAPGLFLLGMLLLGTPAIVAMDATPGAAPPAVERTVFDEGQPDAASGQTLQLMKYDIPTNISLPFLTLPVMQVSIVESGTLHYTVIDGQVSYTRADGETGMLTSGEETDFGSGDRLVEPRGVVHFGENRTDEP